MSPILEISDLSVAYRTPAGDVRAVEGVNLTLNAGEVVGLCGESGSGKSTLAYGATRLLRPPALVTSGSVRYSGRRITQGGHPVDLLAMSHKELHQMRWREVAIVFQSAMNALNPVLRVEAQLLDAIQSHMKMPRAEAKERAAEPFSICLFTISIKFLCCSACRTGLRRRAWAARTQSLPHFSTALKSRFACKVAGSTLVCLSRWVFKSGPIVPL